ncbi:hypothetical protein [Clostridium disporicum]|uniref:hypothetical protein n=1 Tax=Clostridium disporicum TaxID=84024 RepID=UPI0034A26269
MTNNEEKVLNVLKTEVKMPTKIYIGDPMYFEHYADNKTRLNQLTYNKGYRGKSSWVGSVKLTEVEDSFEMAGKTHYYTSVYFMICFAPNQKLLSLYEENMKFNYQKEKDVEIGVDSATYVFGFNKNEMEVRTMSDGGFGLVSEYYNDSKLEGVVIQLNTGEHGTFEDIKKELEYLLDVKF